MDSLEKSFRPFGQRHMKGTLMVPLCWHHLRMPAWTCWVCQLWIWSFQICSILPVMIAFPTLAAVLLPCCTDIPANILWETSRTNSVSCRFMNTPSSNDSEMQILSTIRHWIIVSLICFRDTIAWRFQISLSYMSTKCKPSVSEQTMRCY